MNVLTDILNLIISNPIKFIILCVIPIIIILLRNNGLLFHRNIIKDYYESVSYVESSYNKIKWVNIIVTIVVIISELRILNYSDILTVISILTTASLTMFSALNSEDLSKYYAKKESNDLKPSNNVVHTNSIIIFSIFISVIIILTTIIVTVSPLYQNLIVSKIILILTLFYLENFFIIIKKFVNIFSVYKKDQFYDK